MKNIFLLSALFVLFSCSSGSNQANNDDSGTQIIETTEAENNQTESVLTCVTSLEEIIRKERGRQVNVYVGVDEFQTDNMECWDALKQYAEEQDISSGSATFIHFLDSKDFTPPNDGQFYGNEEERSKVIAQYAFYANGKSEFFADPLYLQKYTMPKAE